MSHHREDTYDSYRRSQGFRTRGATRGGKGLFKWDEVRDSKDRSNYLGQTVKLNDRWYESKKLTKATNRKKVDFKKMKEEKRAIRNREKQLLDQCLQLGTSLPRIEEITHSLYVSDVNTVMKEHNSVDRVKGLGYDESILKKRKKKTKKKKKKKRKKKSKKYSTSSSSMSSSSSLSSGSEEEEKVIRKKKKKKKRKKKEKKKKSRKRKRGKELFEPDRGLKFLKKRKLD